MRAAGVEDERIDPVEEWRGDGVESRVDEEDICRIYGGSGAGTEGDGS